MILVYHFERYQFIRRLAEVLGSGTIRGADSSPIPIDNLLYTAIEVVTLPVV